jgi:hypothetical protein
MKTNHRPHGKILVLLMITTLTLAGMLIPQTVLGQSQEEEVLTLNCNADTYIDEQNSATNYGNASTLLVKSNTNGNARTYIGFPIQNIPFGSVIINASLTVYINQSSSSLRKLVIHRVDQQWDEDTMTWENQPWWAQDVDTVTVSPTASQVTFDVTPVLREYSSMGWPLTGFVIRDEVEWDWRSSELSLASKENPSQSGAVLNVTVSYAPTFMINVMPDWTNGFAGDTLSFNYLLASLNAYEGTVTLAFEALDSTMTGVFDSNRITLSAGDGRYGSFTIATTLNTPATKYNLRINATGVTTAGETSSQVCGFVVEMDAMVVLRDLPYSVQNNTVFPVTINYYSGTIDATSFVIQEQLPEHCSLVETGTPGELSITLPNTSVKSYTWNTTGNSQTLKVLIANTTSLGSFSVTYLVHFLYTGGGSMPTWLNFNGRYTYLQLDGNKWDDNTLGDSGVEVPIGLPGNFDDDGRIDDWEMIEAIGQWIRGQLSDDDLLSYIQLWKTTSIEQPSP